MSEKSKVFFSDFRTSYTTNLLQKLQRLMREVGGRTGQRRHDCYRTATMTTHISLFSLLATLPLAVVLSAGCLSSDDETIPIHRGGPVATTSHSLAEASLVGVPAPNPVSAVEVRVAPEAPKTAKKTRALLIVQQHGGSSDTTLLRQQLGDWLASAFGAGAFSIVNPHDVVGTEQNVGPWGETMPATSATSLAEAIGTEVLLTASVTDVRTRHVGGTEPGDEVVADITLSAKAVPGGDLLASVNVTASSKKQPSMDALRENEAELWSGVAKEAAYAAAPALQAKWAKTAHPAAMKPVLVRFSANVPGAVLRIDGTSRGTLGTEPLDLRVSPGIHRVEIAYPGMVPFTETTVFRDGSAFTVTLVLTEEAAAAAKRDTMFASLLERARQSGLTDDLVRELVARGYSQYLSASHTKLDGMPQTLGIGGDAPNLGLAPIGTEAPSPVPTTNELLDKAKNLAQ